MNKLPENPFLTLPAGTQIVTRIEIRGSQGGSLCPPGSVGIILQAPPDHRQPYLVRFVNGVEALLDRQQLTVRKHLLKDALLERAREVQAQTDLYQHVIYRCIVGSRAYGLEHDASDTDRRGIYLPPAELEWSLYGVPEQLDNHTTQETYWELEKFVVLALRANPNILECLYTPLVEMATPLAQELLELRSIFLSQFIYQTYNGYVMSQFKKLESDLRNHGSIRWKHATHLIRLLLSGITILNEGFVPVRLDEYRQPLLQIKNGEMAWDEINRWRLQLHDQFDAALVHTQLPEEPDFDQANAFIIRARRSRVEAA